MYFFYDNTDLKMYLFRPDIVSSNGLLPIFLTSEEEKDYFEVKNDQISIISPSKDYMKLKNNLISIIPPSKDYMKLKK